MLLRSKKTEDVCKEFLEKLKSERKKLSTRANYQQKIYKYILPNLPFLAKKIRKSDCDCLINSLKETLSYKSINDIIILMNSIFIFSFEKKYMKKLIKLAKTEEHPVDNIEVFTKEEQEKLQEYLLSHLDYFNFSVLLALGSGIRIGDADGKISLNQQKPSKHAGLRRFGPEKFLQRNNEFMKERPIFYKKPIKTEKDFSTWLRCFYYTTKAVITEYIYF